MTTLSPEVERMLPLYEAKMIHQFDYRWSTYGPDGSVRDVLEDEKRDPSYQVMPRYWVREEVVRDNLRGLMDQSDLHGYRWISNATNERTLIASRFPVAAVGNSLPVFCGGVDDELVCAVMNSFACDYVTRQMLGGQNMTFGTVYQLPLPHPDQLDIDCPWSRQVMTADWIRQRSLRLPSIWGERRASIRAELDAACFHLYDVEREDVDYIMETFPIVKRKDIAAHGEYRTKTMILDIYDQMAEAIAGGPAYVSPFDEEAGDAG